jgi:hypothetical protein
MASMAMNAHKRRLATKSFILFSSVFVILKMKSVKTMASNGSSKKQSCTNKISKHSTTIAVKPDEKSSVIISQELNAYDTPGIADSEGRSEQFLNDIAEKIKTTPLNLLIILVEYGRHDTSFYNNLEVLRECLNGLSQSSSMLIVV